MSHQSKTNSYTEFFYKAFRNILLVSAPLVIISALILGFCIPHSSAEVSSGTDNISLTLSTSCTVNAAVTIAHETSLHGGQKDDNVGNTKLSAFCNDNNGYSIYAVGSSGDIDGNTDLINTVNESYNIHTGVYDDTVQSNPSSWAMKLTAGTGTGIDPTTGEPVPTTPPTIVNGFDNYSTIPNVYTQVAKRTSGTSMTTDTSVSGSYLSTTYQIYANSAQPAGTYNGKVKYVIVHPSSSDNNLSFNEAYALNGKNPAIIDGANVYYAMQDMNTTICNMVSYYNEPSQTQLVDTRDNKLYWVAKLDDDKCWMTSNLDLDIGGANTTALNSNNTDISTTASGSGIYANGYTESGGVWTWIPVSTAITANTHITYPNNTNNPTVSPAWPANNYTTPYSAEGGDTYYYTSNSTSNDTRYTSLKSCTDAHPTESECEHYFAGNYYNWTAAIASNNSSNISTDNSRATNSICPKGWRLPNASQTDNEHNEFGVMLYKAGITAAISAGNDSVGYKDGGFNKLRSSPYYLLRSGGVNGNTLYVSGSISGYWPSAVNSNIFAYYLRFSSADIYPSRTDYRYNGWSVRCVAR